MQLLIQLLDLGLQVVVPLDEFLDAHLLKVLDLVRQIPERVKVTCGPGRSSVRASKRKENGHAQEMGFCSGSHQR